MDSHDERQELHRRFDAAVEQLPDWIRKCVVKEHTTEGMYGNLEFRDKENNVIANAFSDGTVGWPVDGKRPRPPARRSNVRYVEQKVLTQVVKAIATRITKAEDCLLAVTKALSERIASMESSVVTKAIDAEAYDTMTTIAERLDQLEASFQDIRDGAIRYRGFWNDGMNAQRGDAFTHDGHAWWCVRATTDRPSTASTDWHLLVRKGRDGR